MNHEELRILVNRSFEVKKALFVWGGTGLGKSEVSKQTFKEIAKENNREFVEWNKINDKEKQKYMNDGELRKKDFIWVDLRLSQLDSTDFKGLPKLDGGDYCEWMPPLIFRVLSLEDTMASVFLDEFNTASPSVQAACMQAILDREIGEIALSKDVYLMAAGNRGAEDKSATFDIAGPLLNRFAHCELRVPTALEWTTWSLKNNIDERIIGFINFKESDLWKWSSDSKEKSFPTPRSWADTSLFIKGVTDIKLIRLFATAKVGEGTALEFSKFVEIGMKINLEDYLKHPEKLTKITQMDVKYALLSSAVELYRKKPEELARIGMFIKYIEQKEFNIYLLKMLRGTDDALNRNYLKSNIRKIEPVWKIVMKDYAQFLT